MKKKYLFLVFILIVVLVAIIKLLPKKSIETTAEEYLRQGKPKTAIDFLTRNPSQLINSTDACFIAAQSYQLLRIQDDSVDYFYKKAIENIDVKDQNATSKQLWLACHHFSFLRKDTFTIISQEAIEYYTNNNLQNTPEYGDILFLNGKFQAIKGNLSLSEEGLKESVSVYREINYGKSYQIANAYTVLGQIQRMQSKYADAVKSMLKAEEILLNLGGFQNYTLSVLYVNLAGCYVEIGSAKEGVDICLKGIQNMKANDSNHMFLANIYNTAGNAYVGIQEYPTAIDYFKQVIQLKPDAGRYYNNLGNAYMDYGDTTNATVNFQKAIKLLEVNPERHAKNLARPYHNLGIIFRQQEKYRAALQYEKKSFVYRKMSYGNTLHLDVARTCIGIADSYAKLELYSEAKSWYDSAIIIQNKVIPNAPHPEKVLAYLNKKEAIEKLNYSSTDILNQLDSAIQFSNAYSPATYIDALSQKADYLLTTYKNTKKFNELTEAFELFSTAINTLMKQRQMLINQASKFHLSSTYGELFEKALFTCYLINENKPDRKVLEQMFLWSETSKSLTLLESINAAKALNFGNIDQVLLQKEKDLKIKVSNLERERLDELELGREVNDLEKELFSANQAYQFLIEEIAEKFPNYFKIKHNQSFVTAPQIQNKLSNNQSLLEFFVGQERIYIFCINAEDYQVHAMSKDYPLEKWIASFRSATDNAYFEDLTSDYNETAYNLYQKLIFPVAKNLKKELIIVNDGVLGYLPFEALLEKPNDNNSSFKGHNYLINQKQISYCYSATLLEEMQEKKHVIPPTKQFLGFSPFSYQEPNKAIASRMINLEGIYPMSPLPESGNEIAGIQKIMSTEGTAEIFENKSATEERFKATCSNFRFIHLATHGSANDEVGDYSFLAFSEIKDGIENELLFVRDLYNLQLNADMVVLSACETGTGELKKGEGIISLARGFTYAGAKSIITSLWKVDDLATKDLMIDFYKHLKKGMSKDAALRKAKLDYIKNVKDPFKAHPIYWSGFIGIGDMRKLEF